MINFCKLIKDWSFLDKVETKHHCKAFYKNRFGEIERIWDKDVEFRKEGSEIVVDFGGPIRYYLIDIKRHVERDSDLCIDAGGRNHGVDGSVYIKKDAFKEIIRLAQKFSDSFYVEGKCHICGEKSVRKTFLCEEHLGDF